PCPCDECTEDRLAGCQNPHKCAQTAKDILDNLLPKFNPNTTPRKDNLTLTHRRLEKNARARKQPQGEVLFDPAITARDNLSDCFRIFTLPSRSLQIPAYRLRIPAANRQTTNEVLTIFTDGSCINNGKYNAKCGGGIWVEDDHPMNREISMPGTDHSNQIGELIAVLVALQNAPLLTPIKIMTD
ncbi:hypothetical protein DFJ58DRAFT_611657, partial [Suillus subalutaceus]|uniref:uncharacterized protein n=1 Tax=Suillus subalutaceus TaxID=48586 RepID=UPI001B884EA0